MISLVRPELRRETTRLLRRAWALQELAHMVAEDSRKLVARSEELVALGRRGLLRVHDGQDPRDTSTTRFDFPVRRRPAAAGEAALPLT